MLRTRGFKRPSTSWWRHRHLIITDRICLSTAVNKESVSKPTHEFLPAYDPKVVESDWQDWWKQKGFFSSSSAEYGSRISKEPFTMLLPPPNVTGDLHIGHALTASIQDAIARWHRMSGHTVSWIPGTDHAGIATQTVVERSLMKSRQVTRLDIGRDAFVKEVWKWKEKHGDRIIYQLHRLGASLDWEKLFFTMDAQRSEAVTHAFIRLFNEGLIYRDTRLVNWCCALQTALSDIEVDYETVTGRTMLQLVGRNKPVEFGVLHKFAYPLSTPTPSHKELVVSTTRIETMLGDCAVAIHPDDPRYIELHGKSVIHPVLGKTIPIICDADLVDMEFGTGAVKVTPAHDPNDYSCGRRHGLTVEGILGRRGELKNCGVPEYEGMDRFDVREDIIRRLRDAGVYRGQDSHTMRIARCSRTGDVIEPMVQPQWYVRCSKLAKRALEAVEMGEIGMHSLHKEEWRRWLDNIQDWCISRQLWWGHRIPAYRIKWKDGSKKESWIAAASIEEARSLAHDFCSTKNISSASVELAQDEDVLDTWFSSALLPLSALGWNGKESSKIPTHYPTTLIETGTDILFFWVARMVMLCTHFGGHVPFKDILLHAMVRDAQGRKMSKSLGNVIDPLHVIEGVTLERLKEGVISGNLASSEVARSIALLENEFPDGIKTCGADALRFSLVSYTQQNRQINMDISNVISTRHFCNKLWNVVKFALHHLSSTTSPTTYNPSSPPLPTTLANRYILSRLEDTVTKCDTAFVTHKLHEGTEAIRQFVVGDLCDVYVELSKTVLYDNQEGTQELRNETLEILGHCLDTSLRLAHPFAPFVTEELWQHLQQYAEIKKRASPPSIMVSEYPNPDDYRRCRDSQIESDMATILGVIRGSRSLRQRLRPSKNPSFIVEASDKETRNLLRLYLEEIRAFTRADFQIVSKEDLSVDPALSQIIKTSASYSVAPNLKIFLPATPTPQSNLSLSQLSRKLEKVNQDIERLKLRMSREEYESRVPEEAKAKDRRRHAALEEERQVLESNILLLQN
ncbi:uncharacterized protein VTP21DRAFT_11502 [Calcarisporiella thermophila]|uniref:uncharacterized protein n=1 Tax=Calcarisporiella thermophila TaxID=911321 RepID=UPI0037429FEF